MAKSPTHSSCASDTRDHGHGMEGIQRKGDTGVKGKGNKEHIIGKGNAYRRTGADGFGMGGKSKGAGKSRFVGKARYQSHPYQSKARYQAIAGLPEQMTPRPKQTTPRPKQSSQRGQQWEAGSQWLGDQKYSARAWSDPRRYGDKEWRDDQSHQTWMGR